MYIQRDKEIEIRKWLDNFPAVAILGARQTGKSTLAKKILESYPDSIYLDLEKSSDIIKLSNPEAYLELHKNKLICLDEVQRKPELFSHLRSYIDENGRNGQLLLLGSASPQLLKQSSETLAGRIQFTEIGGFTATELNLKSHLDYIVKGGFPKSYLANDLEVSVEWRRNFIKTFLERDIPSLTNVSPQSMQRLWRMLSHLNGQIINYSQLGNSLGISHTTVRDHIEIFENTFILRALLPYSRNVKKRLIKSPKYYFRDTGILNTLLNIDDFETLFSHPVYGSSWESMCIENILQKFSNWEASFYRTSNGSEIDLILSKGNKEIAVEFKTSSSPKLTKGFWNSLNDLEIQNAYVIAPVRESYPLKDNVMVMNLYDFLELDL